MTIRRRLIVATLPLSLVGVMGVFAPTVAAQPTPSPTAELSLTPTSGPPGTVIEAVAIRLKCSVDLVEFGWAGHEDVTWSDPVPVDGNLSATTTVPEFFAPGDYEIQATCYFIDGAAYVRESFTVTPGEPTTPASLTLDPEMARPGSLVTATVTGLDCPPRVTTVAWVEQDVLWGKPVDAGIGQVSATSTVPESFSPGTYEVVASCRYVDESDWPRASFTVTEVEVTQTPAVLRLTPRAGPAGSKVTANASGYSCDGDVVFLWHGVLDAGRAQLEADGVATAQVTVPSDFDPGSHDLLARCEADGYRWPLAFFSVAKVEVAQTPAVLRLTPGTGPAGSEVTANASGYACDGDVVFSWPGDVVAGRAQPDDKSSATARVTVPTDFTPGTYRLLARCEADGFRWPPASFTVTEVAAVTPTGSDWSDEPLLPAIGLLVVVLAAALIWLRVHRGVRWVNAHVRARPGAAARAGVEAADLPPDSWSRDVSIRIEPHLDIGTRTVREVGA